MHKRLMLGFATSFFRTLPTSLPTATCRIQAVTRAATTMADLAHLRVNYSKCGLDEDTLTESPFQLFKAWISDATSEKEPEPNAMCLSTADANGRPSARMVLLKGYDERGFVWYTNYESRKAQELSECPYAALTFWWAGLERSVRVEGPVQQISEEESDKYFKSRPPESQLGAWVSDQSRQTEGRVMMEERWEQLRSDHLDGEGNMVKGIERPPHWGGYRLVPDRVEFWKGRSARLHDRIVYERDVSERKEGGDLWEGADDVWTQKRLQP